MTPQQALEFLWNVAMKANLPLENYQPVRRAHDVLRAAISPQPEAQPSVTPEPTPEPTSEPQP